MNKWRRSVALTIGLTALVAPVAAQDAPKRVAHFLIVGKNQEVCGELSKRISRLSRKDFDSGKLSQALGVTWQPVVVPLYVNGRQHQDEARFVKFDVDNDGREEVIISQRWHIRLMAYESWVVLTEAEFAAVKSQGVTRSARELSGNDVDFDGGVSLGVYMVPWSYAGRNYVVFQEATYAQRKAFPFPAHILVSQYAKDPYNDGGRWKSMKVVCAVSDSK